MPKTTLTTRQIDRAARVQRSGYFVDPDGGQVIEISFKPTYTALMSVDEAERLAKRLMNAVKKARLTD